MGHVVNVRPIANRPLMEAVAGNAIVISAADMLPGSLPGVVAVSADESCPRDVYRHRGGVYFASPYPRPIPGVPVSRNLQGISFAVANMTGLAARALLCSPGEPFGKLLANQAEGLLVNRDGRNRDAMDRCDESMR